jgi:hypothetical protein
MTTAVDIVKPAELPRTDDGKMAKVIIAFDVDGTLIKNAGIDREHGIPSSEDVPIVYWINTLQVLSTCKNVKIVVWSGGGKQYAETWGRRLGLDQYVWQYASKLEHPRLKELCDHLIAFDDIQATALGDVNLIVRNK